MLFYSRRSFLRERDCLISMHTRGEKVTKTVDAPVLLAFQCCCWGTGHVCLYESRKDIHYNFTGISYFTLFTCPAQQPLVLISYYKIVYCRSFDRRLNESTEWWPQMKSNVQYIHSDDTEHIFQLRQLNINELGNSLHSDGWKEEWGNSCPFNHLNVTIMSFTLRASIADWRVSLSICLSTSRTNNEFIGLGPNFWTSSGINWWWPETNIQTPLEQLCHIHKNIKSTKDICEPSETVSEMSHRCAHWYHSLIWFEKKPSVATCPAGEWLRYLHVPVKSPLVKENNIYLQQESISAWIWINITPEASLISTFWSCRAHITLVRAACQPVPIRESYMPHLNHYICTTTETAI